MQSLNPKQEPRCPGLDRQRERAPGLQASLRLQAPTRAPNQTKETTGGEFRYLGLGFRVLGFRVQGLVKGKYRWGV